MIEVDDDYEEIGPEELARLIQEDIRWEYEQMLLERSEIASLADHIQSERAREMEDRYG